ncbi:hypothetical protein KIH39_13645 [Telmatocola sphagniphila]|uniref:Lipoprotein n=1 Tax=Telmatocola sphagniphila TaxID=1123043 RepID=A0A8E6B3K6_9BACT|nr:hypothetical protein [Telmatocola sphagniphila]QVL29913.1 hypothetical protein KIH39_13645 [Telmatocola sphagniphila]
MSIRQLKFFVLILVVCGCNKAGHHVRVTLPVGFQGEIKIYHDDPLGEEILIIQNQVSLQIPDSGVLRIKNKYLLYEWHSKSMSFADGEAIPDASLDTVSDLTIAKRAGGSDSKGYVFYFVGDLTHFNSWKRKIESGLE